MPLFFYELPAFGSAVEERQIRAPGDSAAIVHILRVVHLPGLASLASAVFFLVTLSSAGYFRSVSKFLFFSVVRIPY